MARASKEGKKGISIEERAYNIEDKQNIWWFMLQQMCISELTLPWSKISTKAIPYQS